MHGEVADSAMFLLSLTQNVTLSAIRYQCTNQIIQQTQEQHEGCLLNRSI